MALQVDARVIELLTARLCHDLIGPVSAIANGVELLDDDDPEFFKDAVALVGDSARKAIRRLQFYRFAYGFRPGGLVSTAPNVLVADLLEGAQIACDYPEPVRALPLEWQKLVCNLIAIAADALPRGGRLALVSQAGAVTVEASGEGNGPPPEICEALTLTTSVDVLTPRTVAAYFTRFLGETLGCRLSAECEAGRFRLAAAP